MFKKIMFVCLAFLITLNVSVLFAQTDETVVATVGNIRITQADVDKYAAGKLIPLQEQIGEIRRTALESIIVKILLEKEAKQKGISVEEFKKSLTNVDVIVPLEEIEKEYLENIPAFASMNPDEAKERIRLAFEAQARMRVYVKSVKQLKNKADLTYLENFWSAKVDTDEKGPSLGNEKAKITIIEFSDFQCPYCKNSNKIIKQVVQNYGDKVKVVFKHLPLQPNSHILAQAAVCADKQNQFWNYHDSLFEAEDMSENLLIQIAEQHGLNVNYFKECLTSNDSNKIVLEDINEAKRLGIEGTPTFIVNGKIIQGVISYERFSKLIADEQ